MPDLKNSNVTIHFLVRDEINTVAYSLASTAPYAARVLVTDTGSTDGTWKLLKCLKSAYSNIEIERVDDVPDSRDFRWNGSSLSINFEPNDGLTRTRQRHIDRTDTKWVWIVDADEVYLEESARKLMKYADYYSESDCIAMYVPFLHFAQDRFHTADGFPYYGRLFRRDNLSVKGIPFEYHYYNDEIITPNTGNVLTLDSDLISPVCHYQMLYKPYRRTVENLKDYIGHQPEVFSDKRLQRLTLNSRYKKAY